MEHSPSFPQSPGDLLVQGKVHPFRLTATTETTNFWHQCLPEWWQYHLANFYSLGTTSIVSETTNPSTEWSQSADAPTVKSHILSQSQNPEKPSPTLVHGSFDWSFSSQAAAMPDCRTHAEYSQHIMIQEEDIQLTRRQLPDPSVDSLSTPGGNVELGHTRNANTFPSDVCPSQVPQQHWEEHKEARKYPDTAVAFKSESRGKAPRWLHRCTKCNKAYQRRQDLKRHTRDKHIRQRKCPFCCTTWTRPERIRFHLMKNHGSRFTEDQQQEIRVLRGRNDTIHFLEKYGNTTHLGSYTPD
ncbi:hypothetical protein EI94DRAFT_1700588 [Lactarius quietus]|nr:hypothetical protein EI94DRAFT_1700588 [Lactarius quietus]